MNKSTPGRITLIILSSILITLIIIPYLYPYGYITNLDGSIGVIDHDSLWNKLDPISKTLYMIGDFSCHQQMNRTFILNGSEIALCIRDFSVLTGVSVGLILTDSKLKLIKIYNIKFIKLALMSLILSSSTLIELWIIKPEFIDSPILRATMGILSGIGISMILQIIIKYEFMLINRYEHINEKH